MSFDTDSYKIAEMQSAIQTIEQESLDPVATDAEISPIDLLDYDCLEQIFIRLPVVERLIVRQVCTKWREVSEFIWANVKKLEYQDKFLKCLWPDDGESCHCNISSQDIKLKFYYIPNLVVLCGRYVRELDISKFYNSIILTVVKGCFPNLVKFTFSMYEWKDEHIKNLFTGMTKLESLYMTWNHLKILPLTFFETLNDVVDTLNDFVLFSGEFHTDIRMKLNRYLLDDSYLSTIRRLGKLHRLILSGFKMNENTVEAICQLKNLKKLHLARCMHENVSMMEPLLYLINLESLDPGMCSENCDSFLKKIPDKLKNLKYLQLLSHKLTDAGVSQLTNLKNLKSIFLFNMDQAEITDYSIEKFKNMQKITIRKFPLITDDSIIRILDNSPNLESIIIEQSGITFLTVQHIVDIMRKRTNNTRLSAKFDIPDDTAKLQGNIPANLDLEFIEGNVYF